MEKCRLDCDFTGVVQGRFLKDQERAWRSTLRIGFQFRQTTCVGGNLSGTSVESEGRTFDEGINNKMAGHRVDKFRWREVTKGRWVAVVVRCTTISAIVGFIAMEDDGSGSRIRGN